MDIAGAKALRRDSART